MITGCSRDASSMDKREDQDPMMRRATERKRTQDYDGAIAIYTKVLETKPNLARAHLELGLLYDGQKQDYIRAIYHYQRYLELRPAAEKKNLISDLIRRAKISFAASLPDPPPGAMEEIAELKRENSMLRSKLIDVSRRLELKTAPPVADVSTSQPPTTTRAAASSAGKTGSSAAPTPAPARPTLQTYVVQPGDTLTKIAIKIYNDPRQWEKIFEANRAIMGSPTQIKVGQTLIIPK